MNTKDEGAINRLRKALSQWWREVNTQSQAPSGMSNNATPRIRDYPIAQSR